SKAGGESFTSFAFSRRGAFQGSASRPPCEVAGPRKEDSMSRFCNRLCPAISIPSRKATTKRSLQRAVAEALEPWRLLSAVNLIGTAGDDLLVVTADGPDSGSYTLNAGPAVPFSGLIS